MSYLGAERMRSSCCQLRRLSIARDQCLGEKCGDLGEVDAILLDLVDGSAAVQHVLMEPAPDALPGPPRIHSHRIQDHRDAGEAAEGRLVLRAGTTMRQHQEGRSPGT